MGDVVVHTYAKLPKSTIHLQCVVQALNRLLHEYMEDDASILWSLATASSTHGRDSGGWLSFKRQRQELYISINRRQTTRSFSLQSPSHLRVWRLPGWWRQLLNIMLSSRLQTSWQRSSRISMKDTYSKIIMLRSPKSIQQYTLNLKSQHILTQKLMMKSSICMQSAS